MSDPKDEGSNRLISHITSKTNMCPLPKVMLISPLYAMKVTL